MVNSAPILTRFNYESIQKYLTTSVDLTYINRSVFVQLDESCKEVDSYDLPKNRSSRAFYIYFVE